MSLLLDALKKSAAKKAQHVGDETLLATNNIPPQRALRLWPLFITLIAGAIFGVIGGYYTHLETAPPDQRIFRDTAVTPPIASPLSSIASAPLVPSHAITQPIHETKASPVTPSRAKKMPSLNATTSKNNIVAVQHIQETDSIDLLLKSAYQSYQNGDLATAIQRYREVYAKDQKNRDALLGIAVISQQQRQDDIALGYYRQVLLLDPRDPVAHAGLASLGNGGETASKESLLKKLISQQPDASALHFALGSHYVEQSRWSDAQQAYFNALALEPGNAFFAFNLAISLDHLGQRKNAAKYYQQAIQLCPAGNVSFSLAQARQRLNELINQGD